MIFLAGVMAASPGRVGILVVVVVVVVLGARRLLCRKARSSVAVSSESSDEGDATLLFLLWPVLGCVEGIFRQTD